MSEHEQKNETVTIKKDMLWKGAVVVLGILFVLPGLRDAQKRKPHLVAKEHLLFALKNSFLLPLLKLTSTMSNSCWYSGNSSVESQSKAFILLHPPDEQLPLLLHPLGIPLEDVPQPLEEHEPQDILIDYS